MSDPSATTMVSASSVRYVRTRPPAVAAEVLAEFARQLGNQLERAFLLVMLQIAHLEERLGPHHRADRYRIVDIEDLDRLERRKVGVDLRLARHVDRARTHA